MKYTYIKAQFRTRYIFVCQISAVHVVIVLNTLLQKCVDYEHYLWISSQVQVGVTSKASKALTKQVRPKRLGRSKNTCLLLQQASYSNLLYNIVASASPSCIETHVGLFRLLMKGIIDPFDEKLIF